MTRIGVAIGALVGAIACGSDPSSTACKVEAPLPLGRNLGSAEAYESVPCSSDSGRDVQLIGVRADNGKGVPFVSDSGKSNGWVFEFFDATGPRTTGVVLAEQPRTYDLPADLPCSGDPVDDLRFPDSTDTVPDAIARVTSMLPPGSSIAPVRVSSVLGCAEPGLEESLHLVELFKSDGRFFVRHDDDGQHLRTCGPCEGYTECRSCVMGL